MRHARMILRVLITISMLLLQPAFGQNRKVDLRGHLGHTYLLEDTPPQAWLGGGAITAAAGSRFRIGLEVLHANMFGKYNDYKERALLVTPLVEYEFSPGPAHQPLFGSRARIYPVSGPGTKRGALLRSLAPGVRVALGRKHQPLRRAGSQDVHNQGLLRGP